MAKQYDVSKEAQHREAHEVHDATCTRLPQPEHRTHPENHTLRYRAVIPGTNGYYQANSYRRCTTASRTQ